MVLYKNRQRTGDLIYAYQILRGNYDIDNHLFTPSTSTTSDHTKKLFKHHVHQLYTRSSNRVINDWNSLPQLLLILPPLMILKHCWTDITMIIYLICIIISSIFSF